MTQRPSQCLRESSLCHQREGKREGQKESPAAAWHILPTSNLHTALWCGYHYLLLTGAAVEAQRVNELPKLTQMANGRGCLNLACVAQRPVWFWVLGFLGFFSAFISSPKKRSRLCTGKLPGLLHSEITPCFGKVSEACLWAHPLPGPPTLSPTHSPHGI